MRGILILALTTQIGCTDEPPPPPPAPPPPAKKATSLADGVALANGGQHDQALAVAKELVATDAQNQSHWAFFQQEALRSGKAAETLDGLDAANAIGGNAVEHHFLRGTLAIEADRLDEAVAAGKVLVGVDVHAAAALLAQAAIAGAEVPGLQAQPVPAKEDAPEPVDDVAPDEAADEEGYNEDANSNDAGSNAGAEGSAEEPVEAEPTPSGEGDWAAFVQWAGASTPAQARPFARKAASITGWRAELLRGDQFAARGQISEALSAYQRVVDEGHPLGIVQGNLRRCRLFVANHGDKSLKDVGAVSAGAWGSDAADAALELGDGTSAAEAGQLAVEAYVAGLQPATAINTAKRLYDNRKEAEDAVGAAKTGHAYGRALAAAGRLSEARTVLQAARTSLDANGFADQARAAAWIEAWVAYRLGRFDEVAAAAEGLGDGPRRLAIEALVSIAQGQRLNLGSVPTSGLESADAALIYQEVGALVQAESVRWCSMAVGEADAANDTLARVSSRLCLESAQRAARDGGAPGTREQLLALAPKGGLGDPLRAEVAARAMLHGSKMAFPDAATLPAVVHAWRSLQNVQPPPDSAGDPWAQPIAGWANGRYAAAQADIDHLYDGYAAALSTLPLHRQGPLRTFTVLDGSEGVPSAADLRLLSRLQNKGSIGAALAIHEVEHRRASFGRDFRLGRDPTFGLTDDVRDQLRTAVEQANLHHLLFLAGAGPYPTESLVALVEAEAKAKEEPAFESVLPEPPREAGAILKDFGDAAIMSYQIINGRVTGVVLSEYGGPIRDLGAADEILSWAAQHRTTLVRAAMGDNRADHRAGDRLRQRLLDPFAFELQGVGRYMIIAPDELNSFPFTTFPEQADGLRWLADIRNVGASSSLTVMNNPGAEPPVFDPDLLAFGNPVPPPGEGEEAIEVTVPSELVASERLFVGGVVDIFAGTDASEANWQEFAPEARFIHLTYIEPTVDGGFALSDGPLTLSEIRATPLAARLVMLTAKAPYEIQLARARAFLEAGAHSVIYSAWDIPENYQTAYIKSFYDSLNRDRTPSGALREARQGLIAEFSQKEADDPGIWGSLVLIGQP